MYAGPVNKPLASLDNAADEQEARELTRLRSSEASEAEFTPVSRADDGYDLYDPQDELSKRYEDRLGSPLPNGDEGW